MAAQKARSSNTDALRVKKEIRALLDGYSRDIVYDLHIGEAAAEAVRFGQPAEHYLGFDEIFLMADDGNPIGALIGRGDGRLALICHSLDGTTRKVFAASGSRDEICRAISLDMRRAFVDQIAKSARERLPLQWLLD